MKKSIHFTKMHGAGNDYVYINGYTDTPEELARLARFVSDRHKGIGSDGLVLILPSDKADFRMRMFNADGTEAEMCGNASRCVGKYVYEHKLTDQTHLLLETGAGIRVLELHPNEDGEVESVTVQMGMPLLEPAQIPVIASCTPVVNEPIEIDGHTEHMTCVSMGNPHAVYFTDDVAALDLEQTGSSYENHPRFPRRTNSEFIQVVSPTRIKMRVWERGAGETLACGTGACAAVVACVLNGKTEERVHVELQGGELEIEWNREKNRVYMTGPATTVFEGSFDWEI